MLLQSAENSEILQTCGGLLLTDVEDTWVCHGCIGDPFLKREARAEGRRTRCSYCGKARKGFPLGELADRIHGVLEEQFYLTPDQPQGYEVAMAKGFGWERSGEPVEWVIQEIARVDEPVARDVKEYLSDRFGYDAAKDGEEDPYGDEACYEERDPDDSSLRESWDAFRSEVRFRSRFFSPHARRVLDEIFGDIGTLRTWGGESAVRQAGLEHEHRYVYRARIAYSDPDLQEILKDPVKELGAPPSRKARAGRMNAAGVSVFYGAMDEETYIAEARAPVGSYVVIGRFEIIRPVRLLDFDTLKEVYVEGSHFDPEFHTRRGRASFLEHLVREMSRPVMPRDEEFDYLPTQAVSEYLASCIDPPLDGILFHSSQTGGEGRNFVLFNHARRVEPYKLPEGTELDFMMGTWAGEDDWDDDITVFENVPSEKAEKVRETGEFDPFSIVMSDFEQLYQLKQDEEGDDLEYRDATLRLDVQGVRILKIQAVSYKHRERRVSRYRRTKAKPEDL